jgi:hypothetical protein
MPSSVFSTRSNGAVEREECAIDVGIPSATPIGHNRSRPTAPLHDERGGEKGSRV